jgi:hypothetical protein
MKRAHKRVDLLEAEQKGNFSHAKIRAREEASRGPMTDIIKNVLVCGAQFAKSALKSTHAHTQRFRNLVYSGTISGHRLAESIAHVIGKRPCRIAFRERQL